ncbi:MAG: DNA replication and repair protein RecF [Candidatus Krumholzibacteriota bacterium]
MRILSATVHGFRNLQETDLTFSPGVNLVLGRNGEGKTNLLEALNYLALGRSHRSGKPEEMINFDKDSLHVALEVEEDSGSVLSCEFGLERGGRRRFRMDGENVRRRADLVGRLVTVFFNPESIRLVRGAPQRRRHFTDHGMSEFDPLFLSHLTSLQRVTRQKTGLLRDLKKGLTNPAEARRELDSWNRELSSHAAEVCAGRWEYAQLLTPFAQDNYNSITDSKLAMHFRYRPNLESVKKRLENNDENPFQKEDLAADIFAEMDYIMDSEIRRGRPLIGPQLDDFEVLLDGVDLRVYGSQGETRSAAIAMILARSDVLFRKRNIRPVLFFDDIFSELDRHRTRRLQELSSWDHQVFVATARRDDVAGWSPDEMKAWNVQGGGITEDADDLT